MPEHQKAETVLKFLDVAIQMTPKLQKAFPCSWCESQELYLKNKIPSNKYGLVVRSRGLMYR